MEGKCLYNYNVQLVSFCEHADWSRSRVGSQHLQQNEAVIAILVKVPCLLKSPKNTLYKCSQGGGRATTMGLKLAVLCSQGGGRATTMGLRLAVLCSQGGGRDTTMGLRLAVLCSQGGGRD